MRRGRGLAGRSRRAYHSSTPYRLVSSLRARGIRHRTHITVETPGFPIVKCPVNSWTCDETSRPPAFVASISQAKIYYGDFRGRSTVMQRPANIVPTRPLRRAGALRRPIPTGRSCRAVLGHVPSTAVVPYRSASPDGRARLQPGRMVRSWTHIPVSQTIPRPRPSKRTLERQEIPAARAVPRL